MAGRSGTRAVDDVSCQIELDYVLSAAARARTALAESMAGQKVADEVVHEAQIVVSELVTNSVQHARPAEAEARITLTWSLRKGVIEVAVSDAGGGSAPLPARRHVLADSGRGLRIVRHLAHEWGVIDGRHGQTVWASLGGPSRRRTR